MDINKEMSYNYLPLDKSWLSYQQVSNFLQYEQLVSITWAAHDEVLKCRKYLDDKLDASDDFFYGINTGFGYLQNIKIDKDQLSELQENLIKSHACGLGEEVPKDIVRLMMMLKIKSLSYGNSGIGIEVIKRLMDMHNNDVLPVIYTQGSLGASGDLAPLSHLSLPLIGLGEVNHKGKKHITKDVFDQFGWKPIKMQSKEGLALINGTQFMSAYGLYILVRLEKLIKWADLICSISFDAFNCSKDCINEKLHSIRSHKGQVETASIMRKILQDSEIFSVDKKNVQDPYSFRCIPQVHGATKDAYEFVLSVFLKEANSVTDNPNIFPDDDLILSGGNFHGQPLAINLDFLAIAAAELGNISERRIYQMLSGSRELPLFLIKDPGLHSGLMIPQYTAAGIVSENKQLCTPSSVDSISSSNNQEDHVSMGANAATKCLKVIENLEKILAIELLTAAQALEFRRPMRSSEIIERTVSSFRKKVSFNNADRVLHHDMIKAITFLREEDPA